MRVAIFVFFLLMASLDARFLTAGEKAFFLFFSVFGFLLESDFAFHDPAI